MKKLVLLLLLSVFIFGFVSLETDVHASVESDSGRIVNEYFKEMEVSGYKLKSKEIINDFNNNKYYLFEFAPKGYAVFEFNTETFIEGSFATKSPYALNNKLVKSEKYYLGPLNYFVKSGNLCYDIKNDKLIEYSLPMAIQSNEFNKTLIDSKIIQEESESLDYGINSINYGGWNLIHDHNYFRRLDYFPRNYDGTCGFVALSMLLGYLDTVHNDRIVGDNFIEKSYQGDLYPGANRSLHDTLLGYGHHFGNISDDGYGVIPGQLYETFIDYRNQYIPSTYYNQFKIGYTSLGEFGIDSLGLKNIIKGLILKDQPVIACMASYNYSNPSNPNVGINKNYHCVIVYGYNNDKLLAHFGWEDSYEYIINSILAGGYMSIEYTGSHVHSRNHYIHNEARCGCTYCVTQFLQYNATLHKQYCSYCWESSYQSHRWIYEASTGKTYCRDCGYVSSVSQYSIPVGDNQLRDYNN